MILAPPNPTLAKDLGAFYTPLAVARFLVRWSVRAARDVVLDPSSGGGVFLKAAAERINELGGDVGRSVLGVELDAASHAASSDALIGLGIQPGNLRQDDFFAAAARFRDQVDVVIGNPPFIRYQQFKGDGRRRAGEVLRREGVRVSELASSWAPFVVCGAAVLRRGGRLAMVVPMELSHAGYAVPVLAFLARRFRCVQFLSFSQRLFPHLSQDTLLLLADDKGDHDAEFRWKHLADACALESLLPDGEAIVPRSSILNTSAIADGRQRLIEHFLPTKTRELYAEMRSHPFVSPLGAQADVGIGYVTGANNFFHLAPEEAKKWQIPQNYLRRAVCRGRAFTGLRFTKDDWAAGCADRSAANLLSIPQAAAESLPIPVQHYLQRGKAKGVPDAYKCRVRPCWFSVPHVYTPDAFLTYMSGSTARFVANAAGAVAPNTLHIVRMHPLIGGSPLSISISWQTALTELSAEIEGHAMGGGLLKLEPSEAGRVLVAIPPARSVLDTFDSMDSVARAESVSSLGATVDRIILRDQLGLTADDCRRLREAADLLRQRRLGLGRTRRQSDVRSE